MTRRRPTLLISNILPERPGKPAYNAFVGSMWDSLLHAAKGRWDVVREWSQLDGPEGAVARARRADAIVIMGGEDVDPSWYGGPSDYPEAGDHWLRADAGQIALVRTAVQDRIPLLGICRGMQVLDVALGGSLVQHITEPGHLNPDVVTDRHFARHAVRVRAGSLLESVLGPLAHEAVHSAHHQCVDRLGEGLVVSATAPDGIVEAVEHHEAPVLGVQWHPEDPAADPASLHALLGALEHLGAVRGTPTGASHAHVSGPSLVSAPTAAA